MKGGMPRKAHHNKWVERITNHNFRCYDLFPIFHLYQLHVLTEKCQFPRLSKGGSIQNLITSPMPQTFSHAALPAQAIYCAMFLISKNLFLH